MKKTENQSGRIKCNCPCHTDKGYKHVSACCNGGYIDMIPPPVAVSTKEYTCRELQPGKLRSHAVVDPQGMIFTHALMHPKDAALLAELLTFADKSKMQVHVALTLHSL